ncbi:SHOCT domain-containing protein [Microbacterium sp. MAHUQ-60]|uniref:SHOCT domain-containing protein n=1 Tax=unclassified Microbacterium TaxID=2609290 RepID=UPI00360FE505
MDDVLFDAGPDFSAVFVLFGLLFAGVVIFTVVVAVRKWNVAKQAGYDPLTMDTQIAAQVGRSALLRASDAVPEPPSIEQRLSVLDDLHARGVISDDEHVAARAKALEG